MEQVLIKRLHIFHFNDMHGHLAEFHGPQCVGGKIGPMKSLVDATRQEPDSVVLWLGCGDDHIGHVFDELWEPAQDSERWAGSVPYAVYSQAGLDAVCLGNHELDRGSRRLAEVIAKDASFPVLCGNLRGSDYLNLPASVVIERQGLRIGVVAVVTPSETYLHTRQDPDLDAIAPLQVVQAECEKLLPEVDVICLLSHVGYNGPDGDKPRYAIEQGDWQLAEYLDSLPLPTVLLGGHTHHVLNENGLEKRRGDTPVCQAGSHGRFLGQVTLDLHSRQWQARLHHIASQPLSGWQQSVLQPYVDALHNRLQQVLAVVPQDAGFATEKLLVERYCGHSVLFEFFLRAMLARSLKWPQTAADAQVDIAILNATALNKGLKPGAPVTYGDWHSVMPFADELVLIELTAEQLGALLTENARRCMRPEQVVPGQFVAGGYLHVLGRQDVALMAQDNGRKYRVLITSYLAQGKEGWRTEQLDFRSLPQLALGYVLRDEVAEHLREHGFGA